MNKKDLELVDAAVKRLDAKFAKDKMVGGRQDRDEFRNAYWDRPVEGIPAIPALDEADTLIGAEPRPDRLYERLRAEIAEQRAREEQRAFARELERNAQALREEGPIYTSTNGERILSVPAPTIAGRLQIASDLAEAGMITYEDAPSVLGFPPDED